MKKIIIIILSIAIISAVAIYSKRKYIDPKLKLNNAIELIENVRKTKDFKDGDLIFQTSLSAQSKAIQKATKSKFSHCGIIFIKNDSILVLEAVQPVKYTPIDKWITRGENCSFVLKRLKNRNTYITKDKVNEMINFSNRYLGKNYDLTFEWSDEKIYCSELVWKIYKNILNIEVGKLEKLKDFDLSDPNVVKIMNVRYGTKIPYDETVISPVSVFNSNLLETIYEH